MVVFEDCCLVSRSCIHGSELGPDLAAYCRVRGVLKEKACL